MCYIAILVYACRCKTMFHVYCEKGDPPEFLCEGDEQQLIAKYIFRSKCEPCMTKDWGEHDDQLAEQLKDELEDLSIECLPADREKLMRTQAISSHQRRIQRKEQKVENEMGDVDQAVEWLHEHLRAIWTLEDRDRLVELEALRPDEMTVRLNNDLRRPAKSQQLPTISEVSKACEQDLADDEAGPSSRPIVPPPGFPPLSEDTAMDIDDVTPKGQYQESDGQDPGYSGKGKEKEVLPHKSQQPPINDPSVGQEDIGELQQLKEFTDGQ